MSEKKELNQEELEKVTGGVKNVGHIKLYKPSEILSLTNGTNVTIFSGSYSGTTFNYLCDGVITGKSISGSISNGTVHVSGDNAVSYDFCSTGICKINDVESDCWLGPEQIVTQLV